MQQIQHLFSHRTLAHCALSACAKMISDIKDIFGNYLQASNNGLTVNKFLFLPAVAGLLYLAGCTSTIHQTDRFQSGFLPQENDVQTLSIDAKQRVMYTTMRNGNRVICAEPSPDALSAFSSNFGGSLQNNSGAVANLANSITESAASIGLRTQSIQLLRDGMYRSCEAYASGAISDTEYNHQQRRYQNLMLSLLAIEQISGAVVAKQASLGAGNSTATAGGSANETAAELAQTEQDLKVAQGELDTLTKQRDADAEACSKVASKEQGADSNCAKKEGNDQKVLAQVTKVNEAEIKRNTAKINLQAARSAITTSAKGATVNFDGGSQASRLSDASAQYVAEAARTIVSTTLLASFAQEECSQLWDLLANLEVNKSALAVELKKTYDDVTPNKISSVTVQDLASQETFSSFLSSSTLKLSRGKKTEDEKEVAKSIFEEKSKYITSPKLRLLEPLTNDSRSNFIISMANTCSNINNSLLNKSILYTPQYSQSLPLEIVGGNTELTIIGGNSLSLDIIHGVKPYRFSNPENKVSVELIEGATKLKLSGSNDISSDIKTTIYVLDANDSRVDVHINILAAKKIEEKTPVKNAAKNSNKAKVPSDKKKK